MYVTTLLLKFSLRTMLNHLLTLEQGSLVLQQTMGQAGFTTSSGSELKSLV